MASPKKPPDSAQHPRRFWFNLHLQDSNSPPAGPRPPELNGRSVLQWISVTRAHSLLIGLSRIICGLETPCPPPRATTSVLYGADCGSMDFSLHGADDDEDEKLNQKKLEENFDAFTTAKSNDLAQPLVDAQIPFKIHIVQDHDMKERLCLEVERLGLCTMIMGSRGFGASGLNVKGRLGSVSDYYVHHCGCPVIVVRCADEKDGNSSSNANAKELGKQKGVKLPCPVVIEEDEQEYHDALDKHRDTF